MVWGRPVDEKRKDAADDAIAQPLTDLPAAPAPAPAAVELPATPLPIADPIEAAMPVVTPAPVATPVAPLGRRARRAAVTAEQPAVELPSIAPVAPAEAERVEPAFVAELPSADAPAPMIESVLTPAEPFELLEPVIAPEAADEVEVLEVVETPRSVETAARRQRAPRRPLDEPIQAEPVAAGPVVAEPVAVAAEQVVAAPAEQVERPEAAQGAASGVDEFEAAARLFSFTGEFAVPTAAETGVDGETADAETLVDGETADAPLAGEHKAPRKPRTSRGAAFKRVTAASFSVGVMGIVGLMTVGMTTPAEAVAAAGGADASMMSVIAPGDTTGTEISTDEIQAYVAPSTAEAESLDRAGSYDTTTVAELASQAGIRNFSNIFHNDPNAAIQWPFVVGVTMSYGFGMRDGRLHKGIDFTPGAGSPIQAIADGTVRVASEAGGDYGVHVIIDHVIDGKLISSHYAHMQYGSMRVVPGQKVTVGTVLGTTGNTGLSYGAHTHFELLMNGTVPIDPMPWLREHAGG